MFDGLFRFLTGVDDGRQSGGQDAAAFALAILLIEVARSDDRMEAREQSIIERVLARRFDLDRSEVRRLMNAAKARRRRVRDEAGGDLSGQASVSPKNPIPEEIDHREIAVRVPLMSEVQFLLASEPCKTPKA